MGKRDLDRWDFLIVMAILATLTVVLRLNNRPEEPAPNPLLQTTRSDSGMETVWRDAVSDPRDVRPVGDPGMVWEETREVAQSPRPAEVPKADPAPQPQRDPEPYFPKPLQVAEPAAPAPRMEPMRDSLLNASNGANSSAFLAAPEPPKRQAQPAGVDPAPKASSASKASAGRQDNGRFWRRADGQ